LVGWLGRLGFIGWAGLRRVTFRVARSSHITMDRSTDVKINSTGKKADNSDPLGDAYAMTKEIPKKDDARQNENKKS
jgi:hypothetical protein